MLQVLKDRYGNTLKQTARIMTVCVAVFTFSLGLAWAQNYTTDDFPAASSQNNSTIVLSQVCLDYTARGLRSVQKSACTNPGMVSDWLWIGDDTGYRNQRLQVTAWGGAEVCLRFSAVGKRARNLDWVCSSSGIPSAQLWIGDDTGYRQQKLQIRSSSSRRTCLRFTHRGRWGTRETDWVCSAHSQESPWLNIGDDTGYRNQNLKIFIEGTN